MKTQPISKNSPTFGIYKGTKIKHYGQCVYGQFKDNNIEIYSDNLRQTKLYYVTNKFRKWIKSKLVYFENGIKNTVYSEK